MMRRASIVGCGLIGASIALALRDTGFAGMIVGYDKSEAERVAAERLGAFTAVRLAEDAATIADADVVVLATPVLAVLDWMERLAPLMSEGCLMTDVGSTKKMIFEKAVQLFGADSSGSGGATFLPGHPMAGKESGGATLAEAGLFRGATWLFTPLHPVVSGSRAAEWLDWVARMGARVRLMEPAAHDEVCAWVSHLPQMVSTALAALLEDTFSSETSVRDDIHAGLTKQDLMGLAGRALRETTRLGASPYSMWRDVALTNTEPLSATLLALELRLQHLRENLRTPELREEFATANRFRATGTGQKTD